MSSQSTVIEDTSLGEHLRETRNKQGLDLTAIAEETKISLKNLQAIEEGDFTALPAEAFTRGFYKLYAISLSLDPTDVLKRYAEERPSQTKSGNRTNPPGKLAMDVSNMAERPTLIPFSMFGLILLLLLLFGAFLCWYFSWNPATYLSQKLRSLQEGSQQVEQALESRTEPDSPPPLFEFSRTGKKTTTGYIHFSLPSTASASVAGHQGPAGITPHRLVSGDSPDNRLSEDTTAFIWPINDQPQAAPSFEIGQSAIWNPVRKLIITLPAAPHSKHAPPKLPIALSYEDYAFVTLTIPRDSLYY